MNKHSLFFLLIILCVIAIACRSSGKDLIEFNYRDNYLWNGDEAFERIYFVTQIEIGEAFGFGDDGIEKSEMCEIIGENRNEWIYVRFIKPFMSGNGLLYKSVNIPDFGVDTFGVTTIEIQEFGIFHRNTTSRISDRSVIAKTIDVLTNSGDIPMPKGIIESKRLILLSSNYPGLMYELSILQDKLGKRYITKIEDFSRVFEIGGFLDQYVNEH